MEKVQATLLQKDKNLTIDEAVKIGRTEEATRKQVDELRGKTIDMVSKQTRKSSPNGEVISIQDIRELVADAEIMHTKKEEIVPLNLPGAQNARR